MKREIQIGELGHSTKDFNFFVTATISDSVSASRSSSLKSSESLVNKLLSLTSKSKFSVVDSVISKIDKKLKQEDQIAKKSKSSSQFEVIGS